MNQPSDRELLGCPFCGSAAHFESDADGWHWVECASCGMQGNRGASLMEDCRPKLAEQWNRRAHPDVQSGYADGWQDGMSEATSLLAGAAEPVAYLVPRSAFRCSPHGQDAESHEWLEVTEDQSEKDAFPVFAAPQQAPLTDEREAFTAWFDRRDGVRNAWTAWQARAAISQSNAQATDGRADWVPCAITHEGQYPEEVAYGPQVMMDRLKKWLDRYFDMLGNLDAAVTYCPTCCQGYTASADLTRDQVIFESGKAAGRAEAKRLREALALAVDHIDMDALRISHCKDAAAIGAALSRKAVQ